MDPQPITLQLQVEKGTRGLGLTIAGPPVRVTEVASASAADVAGIHVGDVLKSINGHDCSAMTLDEAKLLLAESGPEPVFVIQRSETAASAKSEIQIAIEQADRLLAEERQSGPYRVSLSQLVQLIGERTVAGTDHLVNHFRGVTGLAERLQCNVNTGISNNPEDLQMRRHHFGANRIPEGESKSFLELMWDALQDETLIILIIAATISIILGATISEDTSVDWIEGLAILFAVVVVVVVTAGNDYEKEKQFRALQMKQNEQKVAHVVRDGKLMEISAFDLVVGDVFEFGAGAILPTDGILIRGSDVACDESALTGESKEMKKNPTTKPFMLSGTSVMKGTGAMLVTCVGLFSEEGIIQKLITGVGAEETARLESLDKEARETAMRATKIESEHIKSVPEKDLEEKAEKDEQKASKRQSVLQKKLNKLALQIGYAGLTAGAVCIVVLFIRFSIITFAIDDKGWSSEYWSDFVSFIIIGITVVVVAIPEGLPLAVTIALAYSVKKMMKDNNLVRVLAACETMGNATTICSDKTGTLTKNRMTVVRAFTNKKDYTDPKGMKELPASYVELMALGITVNSDTKSTYTLSASGQLEQSGNKTECACLQAVDNMSDKSHKQYRQEYPESSYVKIHPFSSAKKRMSTVVQVHGKYRVYVKGAPEILLPMCNYQQTTNGPEPIGSSERDWLNNNVIEAFGSQALRVLLIAYRDFDTEQEWEDEDELTQDLTLLLFVGIQDPVRDEVPEAVRICIEAGVAVRMVTGDNVATARAIAINCGIIKANDDFIVMEGPEFRKRVLNEDGSLNFDVFLQIAPRLRVMARCSPTDKYTLVKGLIRAGEVVAVTGDGTNDGPALSEADVGFAMGIAGTGVAKEASDIIITDDNFNSIVKAVSWGRNVYDSIAKFLQFQLTVNIVAISLALIGAFAEGQSPLRAVQLLWVNLIMDTMASLALATEPPTPELLKRKPHGRNEPLISQIMMRNMLGHATYQLATCLTLLFAGDEIFNIPNGNHEDDDGKRVLTEHYTIIFNTFVFMQIFNEINSRKVHDEANVFKGFTNNPLFMFIIGITIVIQVILVEFAGVVFKVTPLRWDRWIACLILGAFGLIWHQIIRIIFPYRVIPLWMLPGATKLTDEQVKFHETKTNPKGAEIKQIAPASVLWVRSLRRVRAHIRALSAFREAGNLRRRASLMANYAIAPPPSSSGHLLGDIAEGTGSSHSFTTTYPARPGGWRSALARLRFQLRVVSAFRNGIARRLSIEHGMLRTPSAAEASPRDKKQQYQFTLQNDQHSQVELLQPRRQSSLRESSV